MRFWGQLLNFDQLAELQRCIGRFVESAIVFSRSEHLPNGRASIEELSLIDNEIERFTLVPVDHVNDDGRRF